MASSGANEMLLPVSWQLRLSCNSQTRSRSAASAEASSSQRLVLSFVCAVAIQQHTPVLLSFVNMGMARARASTDRRIATTLPESRGLAWRVPASKTLLSTGAACQHLETHARASCSLRRPAGSHCTHLRLLITLRSRILQPDSCSSDFDRR